MIHIFTRGLEARNEKMENDTVAKHVKQITRSTSSARAMKKYEDPLAIIIPGESAVWFITVACTTKDLDISTDSLVSCACT
jgi:hypothetical protein